MTPDPQASPLDYRSRAGREAEVLAEIAIDGRLSRAWLDAIPQRRAAWFRLVADGRVMQRGIAGDSILAEVAPRLPAGCTLIHLTPEMRALLTCKGVDFIPGRAPLPVRLRALRLWDRLVTAVFGGKSV